MPPFPINFRSGQFLHGEREDGEEILLKAPEAVAFYGPLLLLPPTSVACLGEGGVRPREGGEHPF